MLDESRPIVSQNKEPSRAAKGVAYATIASMFLGFAVYSAYHLAAPDPEPIGEPSWFIEPATVLKSGENCKTIQSGIHSIEISGTKRQFEVYRPSSLQDNTAAPLVLVIHGLSSSPTDIEKKVKMKATAEKEGWLVAYPIAIGSFKSFNGLGCCADSQDDVTMIKGVIDYMEEHACADTHNVFATGFSNGGFMSHRLGCEIGERDDGFRWINAIAPHSGLIGSYSPTTPYECKPGTSVPILSFHGTSDAVVGYNGNNPNPLSRAVWNSFMATMNIWATNNCGASYTTTTTHPTASTTCVAANGCDVEFCTIEGLAHTWSGDDKDRDDIDATSAVADFFKKHMIQ